MNGREIDLPILCCTADGDAVFIADTRASRTTGAHPMPDIVPLLIAAAVFALFFAYVPLCAKI